MNVTTTKMELSMDEWVGQDISLRYWAVLLSSCPTNPIRLPSSPTTTGKQGVSISNVQRLPCRVGGGF